MESNATLGLAAAPAGPDFEEERRGISALLEGASLELSSRDPAEIEACVGLLEPRTAVYISFPPGQTYHGTVALAVRLARAGFRPVPHVAARRIAGRAALEDFLARAAGEAGVDSALVIAGDSERAGGAFDSSLALLETGCSSATASCTSASQAILRGIPASPPKRSKQPWRRRKPSLAGLGSTWAS